MTDLEFNLDEVTSLARKLSAVQQDLTGGEYGLLLAIFAAAAARAEVTNADTGTSTLPLAEIFGQAATGAPNVTLGDLQHQLLNAYIPGNYFESVAATTDKTVGLRTLSALVENAAADEGARPET